jgi:putative endonuclease
VSLVASVLTRLRHAIPSRGESELGPRGEKRAARHLTAAGYRIVARNLRTRLGELDLVAISPDRRWLVVVEVKAGRAGAVLPPEVHVTVAKQRKISSLAAELVRRKRLAVRAVRFDVIALEFADDGEPIVRHHEAAFESNV